MSIPISVLLPDEDVDELNRIIIDKSRNHPPLGDETVRIELINIEDGVSWFGGIRNEDKNTLQGMQFGDETIPFYRYGITGGRTRKSGKIEGEVGKSKSYRERRIAKEKKERIVETATQAAAEEIYEEAGVLHAKEMRKITPEELGLVCRITRLNAPLRDEEDNPIMVTKTFGGATATYQKRGALSNIMFAHVGGLVLRETDDEEARNPRWSTLSAVLYAFMRYSTISLRLRAGGLTPEQIGEMKEEFMALHTDENYSGIYSLSHIAFRLITLKYMRAGYLSYLEKKARGVWIDPLDRRFYYSMSVPAREDGRNAWAFHKFIEEGEIDGIVLDKNPEDDSDVKSILEDIMCEELARELTMESGGLVVGGTTAEDFLGKMVHEPWGAEQHFLK